LIPAHTGLRGAVQKSFSVPVLRKSKDFLDNLIAMRIESLRDKAQFDVVADYAATIPGVVICSLLGVPVEDQEMFSGWLADQFRLLGPSLPSDALLEEVDQSTRLLLDYTNDLIEKRRKNPQLDIISGLIAAQESDGIEISQRDMAVTTAILLAGGTILQRPPSAWEPGCCCPTLISCKIISVTHRRRPVPLRKFSGWVALSY
jgi:cytochrome P450